MSIGYTILTGYGFALIVALWYIGVTSDWSYFHTGNILLFASILASYPILGTILSLLSSRYIRLRL